MADELKPCPFCGGRAILTEGPHHDPEGCTWEVSCDDCGAQNRCLPSPQAARDAWAARAQAPGAAAAWRPEVVAFANLMEAQLRANDHKGGWRGDPAAALHKRLLEETEELSEALNWRSAFLGVADPEKIGSEAADVANFAMMIADVCGALDVTPSREA